MNETLTGVVVRGLEARHRFAESSRRRAQGQAELERAEQKVDELTSELDSAREELAALP
jgi:exonuclease VII small subunit